MTKYLRFKKPRKNKRFAVTKREWIDPFPEIDGSKPEKMVYAALASRMIPFYFKKDIGDIPETPEIETARPDFLFPDIMLAIVVISPFFLGNFGSYIDKLSFTNAVLQYKGYRVLFWTANDIEKDVAKLIKNDAGLVSIEGKGLPYKIDYPYPWVRRRLAAYARRGGRRPRIEIKKKKTTKRKSIPFPE